VLDRFREGLASIEASGYLAAANPERIALTRDGLLRVDMLLPRFSLPQHAGIRYTLEHSRIVGLSPAGLKASLTP